MDTRCEKLHPDISSACRRADRLLWDAYARSDEKSQTGVSGEGRLVFPRYRKKNGKKEELRVSEQEARFAFVEALCQGPFRYSVETPTDKLYKFTGKKCLSAQTDLAVHDASGRCRICNVEFKEGGISPSAKTKAPISKDVEKLLREPRWGLWFHLLERVNSKTIPNFLCVMEKQIKKVQNDCKFKKESVEKKSQGLTLHVCVLQHGFSLQKDVTLPVSDDELKRELCVKLCVDSKKLTKVKNLNGWELHTKSQVQVAKSCRASESR